MVDKRLGHGVLEVMSYEEEINAPKNVKRTRNNKLQMACDLDWAIKYAQQLRRRVSQIPEENDERHAEMVAQLAMLTRKAYLAMDKACFYNGEGV